MNPYLVPGKPFFSAARELEEAGFAVINPADLDRLRGFDPALADTEGFDWTESPAAIGYDLGDIIEVDSRPSDAIALAVHHDPVLPIFVDDSVLESVA